MRVYNEKGLPIEAVGPTGPVGPVGPANVLIIGTVATGAPGSMAAASIAGTTPSQTLSFVIPRGDVGPEGPQGDIGPAGVVGPANTLVIGTVTTGAPGSAAAATITGVAPNQTLNLTIPTGAQGPQGIQGLTGATGGVGPAGATGAQGPAGPTGATGGVGPAGAQGPQGVQGVQGPQGPVGATGATGPAGSSGLAGAGYGAYTDSTGQRGYFTEYYNTYATPLLVTVSNAMNPANGYFQPLLDGWPFGAGSCSNVQCMMPVSFLVPPGHSYRIDAGGLCSLNNWWEQP